MLLKTHIEKMSVLGLATMLMKTQIVIIACHYIFENKDTYGEWTRKEREHGFADSTLSGSNIKGQNKIQGPVSVPRAGCPRSGVCTFPAQHHPRRERVAPPHLRRGAFRNSPPESGGVARSRRGGFRHVTCRVVKCRNSSVPLRGTFRTLTGP